jgi:WASH complex subunit 7
MEGKLIPAYGSSIQNRISYARSLNESFENSIETQSTKHVAWTLKIESEVLVSNSKNVDAVVKFVGTIILDGIDIASQTLKFIRDLLVLLLKENIALKQSNITWISKGAELIVSIQNSIQKRLEIIASSMPFTIADYLKHIQECSLSLLPRVSSLFSKDFDLQIVVKSIIAVIISCIRFPCSSESFFTISSCLTLILNETFLQKESMSSLSTDLTIYKWLLMWPKDLKRACDCSFFFHASELIPLCLSSIFNSPKEAYRLPLLLQALMSPSFSLFAENAEQPVAQEYKRQIHDWLNSEIINPLCRKVESDLRLHIHSVVLQQDLMSDTDLEGSDIVSFLSLSPMRVWDEFIDISGKVTCYLNKTFYDLSTVTSHDWRVYAEMRTLAAQKFKLDLQDPYLPISAHFSSGLDVLEIMRNIHIFVSKFAYNLNEQVFIERVRDQKYLMAINIGHITNSIRSHGTGIMDTTVDYASKSDF